MTTRQPEALRLAEWFDEEDGFRQGTKAPHKWVLQAAAELRRLHAVNEGLRDQNTKLDKACANMEAVSAQLLEALDSCAGVLAVFVDDGSAAPDSVVDKNLTAARAAIAAAKGEA